MGIRSRMNSGLSDPDPLVRCTDPRIRTKMSRIRTAGFFFWNVHVWSKFTMKWTTWQYKFVKFFIGFHVNDVKFGLEFGPACPGCRSRIFYSFFMLPTRDILQKERQYFLWILYFQKSDLIPDKVLDSNAEGGVDPVVFLLDGLGQVAVVTLHILQRHLKAATTLVLHIFSTVSPLECLEFSFATTAPLQLIFLRPPTRWCTYILYYFVF